MPEPRPYRPGWSRRSLLTTATLAVTAPTLSASAALAPPRSPAAPAGAAVPAWTVDGASFPTSTVDGATVPTWTVDGADAPGVPGGSAGGDRWPGPGPRAVLSRLLAGNRRFAAGRPYHPRRSVEQLRRSAAGQRPHTVVIGCADSRVPPEILFDQGLGDLFGHRVAGNVVDGLLLGSIEYAVAEFAPPVILVLGHERCGAIIATLDVLHGGSRPDGHLGALVDRLRPVVAPVVDLDGDLVEHAVRANVRAQLAAIRQHSALVRRRLAAGSTCLVGARYDLDTGVVTPTNVY